MPGAELVCECGNFEHTGLLCCHALKVLDVLGIDQIPAKYILKRGTKDARDVLPDHLAHLQKDKISANSITFRHSNLYTHALEVVRLGDANTSTYECAVDILKKAMDTLTPMASVRDGMGLEDRIQTEKGKEKELIAVHPAANGGGSDAEGSAIGNFVGLKPPELNQDDQPPAGTSLCMMTEARGAKNASRHQMKNLLTGVKQASVLVAVVSAVRQVTRALHVRRGVIFLGKKGKKQNAQTVVSVVTERTPATNLKLCCMLLKMQLWSRFQFRIL